MATVTRTFSTRLLPAYVVGATIEIAHFRDMTFDADELAAFYLDSAIAIVDVGSFNIGKIAELNGDETDIEKSLAILKAESLSNKIGLKFLTRKNNTGIWEEIAEFIILNYGRKDYLDLRGRLGFPSRVMERNDALAVQLVDYGDGLLWDTDFIKIDFGCTIEIEKKNNVDALTARISALELALEGRIINLPANSLLGRNTGTGVVQQVPMTQFATPAMLNQAITDLVGGAPGALNTLIELAASLNNDANFASTVTNSLATKAPLDSSGKLALPLNKMPIGNAWGQEINHGSLQGYAWNTTPFGTFFAFSFTGSRTIPNQQYYGCKWALGANNNLLGYYVQLLISRFTFLTYLQWVENNVIVKELQVNTTTLF